MVPESWFDAVVIRITKMNNMATNDDGVVGELRAINGEKRTKYVSLKIKNRA
jgi:hypothetical protein